MINNMTKSSTPTTLPFVNVTKSNVTKFNISNVTKFTMANVINVNQDQLIIDWFTLMLQKLGHSNDQDYQDSKLVDGFIGYMNNLTQSFTFNDICEIHGTVDKS